MQDKEIRRTNLTTMVQLYARSKCVCAFFTYVHTVHSALNICIYIHDDLSNVETSICRNRERNLWPATGARERLRSFGHVGGKSSAAGVLTVWESYCMFSRNS